VKREEELMRVLLMAAALTLAACNPSTGGDAQAPGAATTEADGANGCAATESAPWNAGSETLTVEAVSAGADCANAEATITLRRAEGAAMYSQTLPASQIMTLAGAESAADMQRRLQEWVSPPGAAMDSTGDLPEWTANAANPGESESVFHPYGGMDRAAYAALRAADAPMFCFVQGMESQACFYLDSGALRRIGEQQFPG
jgi:predicted small secreted protein